MAKIQDYVEDITAIPCALLRYTFVGFQDARDSFRGCHCHPDVTRHDAVFNIEKNLTRAQAIEELAKWHIDCPYGTAYILPTVVAEDRTYVEGNTQTFGDEIAFNNYLIDKADEYAWELTNIEDAARDRCIVLVEEATAAAEVARQKTEDQKKARAAAEKSALEEKERKLLDELKKKYAQ